MQEQVGKLYFLTPGSPQEGLNTHFEDIRLLAALTVTKFPKCIATPNKV